MKRSQIFTNNKEKTKKKKRKENYLHPVWKGRHAKGKRLIDLRDIDEDRIDEDEEQ